MYKARPTQPVLTALGGKPLHPLACPYGTDARGQSNPAFPHTLHRKLSSVSGDCTCLRTTFGRDRPLRRQLQLLYRPCPARRSLALRCSDGPENGRSARRPTGQPGGRSWASADRVRRRYTPHKTRKNTLKMAFGTTGPHHANHIQWVRIDAHVYTTSPAARAASGDSGWGRYTPATQAS